MIRETFAGGDARHTATPRSLLNLLCALLLLPPSHIATLLFTHSTRTSVRGNGMRIPIDALPHCCIPTFLVTIDTIFGSDGAICVLPPSHPHFVAPASNNSSLRLFLHACLRNLATALNSTTVPNGGEGAFSIEVIATRGSTVGWAHSAKTIRVALAL